MAEMDIFNGSYGNGSNIFLKSMFFLHFVGGVNTFSRVHSRRRSRFFRGNTDFTQAVGAANVFINGSYGNGSNMSWDDPWHSSE